MIIQTLKQLTGYEFVKEFRFHDKRKWRFDYCHVESKTAIEVNGAVFTQGRHTRGKGFINDMEKLNNAILAGYVVLQFTPGQMNESKTFELIKTVIEKRI